MKDGPLSAASAKLVDAGDLNQLTMHVNGLVLDQDWEELAVLREACRRAFERGKQLWPVSAYVEYRMCLDGPGLWAARMLEGGSSRFALGPLPEVAASSHAWEELAPHLHGSPEAAMAAHERAARGEDLSADPVALGLPEVLDLPFALEPWEPAYAVPVYHPDRVEVQVPRLPPLKPLGPHGRVGGAVGVVAAPAAVSRALEELVATWTSESNGRAEAVSVEGGALEAVAALGARPLHSAGLAPGEALAAMAWAAADGGAHGHRRGVAAGRFGAWYVLAALAGVADEWPWPPDALGAALRGSRWYRWGSGEPETGWALRLALEAGGRSWALSAQDDD